ncbi:hypothetical protein PMAYCL1PPCAC_16719, partial [Pristionchus mayeri]
LYSFPTRRNEFPADGRLHFICPSYSSPTFTQRSNRHRRHMNLPSFATEHLPVPCRQGYSAPMDFARLKNDAQARHTSMPRCSVRTGVWHTKHCRKS